MKYEKQKLVEVIENLQAILEYDYFLYPPEDEIEVEKMLNIIFEQTEKWKKMHDDNYSY